MTEETKKKIPMTKDCVYTVETPLGDLVVDCDPDSDIPSVYIALERKDADNIDLAAVKYRPDGAFVASNHYDGNIERNGEERLSVLVYPDPVSLELQHTFDVTKEYIESVGE